MEIELSIVVPAYNEAHRIGACLETLLAFAERSVKPVEIIIVDDHSTDETAAIVERFIEELKPQNMSLLSPAEGRKGKGAAVNRGVLAANGDYILFSDADLSTPITEVSKLLFWAKQGVDVVFGSRSLPESDVRKRQPWHRRAAGAVMRALTRMFIMKGVFDTQCGFKLFSRRAAKEVFARQKVWGWSFDLEILVLAELLGFSRKELPVIWVDSPESKIRFLRDATRMFFELLSISFRLRFLRRIPKPAGEDGG